MAGIFDFLAPALQVGATVLNVGGQLARGSAAEQIGRRRQQAAEFEAEQLEQDAGQSKAVSQRNAEEIGRQTKYINSTALARAAASGAGASDPTVQDVLARTAAEGGFRQATALYEGEAQARLDRMKAAALRFQGDTALVDAANAKRIATLGAGATALAGGVKAYSLYDKYFAGPKKTSTASPALGFFTNPDAEDV